MFTGGRWETLGAMASDVLAEDRRAGRCGVSFFAGSGGSEFGSYAGTRKALDLGSNEGVVALLRVDRPDTEERVERVDAMESLESRRTSACEPLDLSGKGGGPPPLGRLAYAS